MCVYVYVWTYVCKCGYKPSLAPAQITCAFPQGDRVLMPAGAVVAGGGGGGWGGGGMRGGGGGGFGGGEGWKGRVS